MDETVAIESWPVHYWTAPVECGVAEAMTEGEQRLIREQSQWIAPDRLRIVWQSKGKPFPTVETAAVESGNGAARP